MWAAVLVLISVLRLESEKSLMGKTSGTMWKPGVLWEGLLIVALIFSALCGYSEAAGGREDPAAGTEAPGTLLTQSAALGGSILNPQALGWVAHLVFPESITVMPAENNDFRVIFRAPSKPNHHLPSFRFRKTATWNSHIELNLSLLSLHRMNSLKVRAIYGPNENSCLILNLQTLRLEENLHFSLSAAGGTPVPSLSTVPNLKWWVICYGPKGSRKAWPNLTKPEGHKKDFEQNVSGLLALPIPSQLLRANNFHVMAMGERRGEKSEKSFWQKPASSRWKKANELHSVCTNTVCAWLPWVQDWPCSCPWAAALCPSRLWMGISHFMSLPAPLEGQLSTVPAPRVSASRAVQPCLS